MKRKPKLAGLIVLLMLAVACLAIWLPCRHPYESKYFTPEMQAKYQTVESVLDAWRVGWKCDTPEHTELVNEVYGFNVPNRYGERAGNRQDEIDEIKSISYSDDKTWAAVVTDKSGWRVVIRDNRWVFYPETPWCGM